MRSFIKRFFLFTWLSVFVFSLFSVTEYWDYDFKPPDVEAMLAHRSHTEALKTSLEAAIIAEEYEEARSLIVLGQRYNHDLDYSFYQQSINEKDTISSRLRKQVTGFTDGFLSGEGESTSSVAGALTSDFTVVGDVRDLSEQYSRYQQGLPVNELVATLAGVGVGLTAATVGSLGVAAPVKAGASTLKLATRMNRLSKEFRRELVTIAGRVFNWSDFLARAKNVNWSTIPRIARQSYNPAAARRMGIITEQANGIRKSTSMADSIHLLKYVDNTQDLNRVHRLSQHYGMHTRGVFRILGKSAVRGVKVLKMTLGLIISALASLLSAIFFLFSIRKKALVSVF